MLCILNMLIGTPSHVAVKEQCHVIMNMLHGTDFPYYDIIGIIPCVLLLFDKPLIEGPDHILCYLLWQMYVQSHHEDLAVLCEQILK